MSLKNFAYALSFCLIAALPVRSQDRDLSTAATGIEIPTQVGDGPMLSLTIMDVRSDNLGFLNDPSVTKDLEFVGEQKLEFEEIRRQYDEQYRDLARRLQAAGADPTKHAELKKKLADFQVERQNAISAILLPHQIDRLKQIARQKKIDATGGLAASVGRDDLGIGLNISPEQKSKLQKIQSELEDEIAEKIRECQVSSREKVLAVLSAEQRRKLDELIGEKFVPRQADQYEKNGEIVR